MDERDQLLPKIGNGLNLMKKAAGNISSGQPGSKFIRAETGNSQPRFGVFTN
jgi:hypothetical protein